jgi:hypothetical protein
VGELDAQTTVSFVVAGSLMAYAGLGKKRLRLRRAPYCRHCGVRHLPGNCLRSG